MKALGLTFAIALTSTAAFAQMEDSIPRTRQRVECLLQHYNKPHVEKKAEVKSQYQNNKIATILNPFKLIRHISDTIAVNKALKVKPGYKNITKVTDDRTSNILLTGLYEYAPGAFKTFLRSELADVQKKNGNPKYKRQKRIDRIVNRIKRNIHGSSDGVFRRLRRKLYKAEKSFFQSNGIRRKDIPESSMARAIVAYLDTKMGCSNIGRIRNTEYELVQDLSKFMALGGDSSIDVVSYNDETVSLEIRRATLRGKIERNIKFDIAENVSAEDVIEARAVREQLADEWK